MKKLFACLLTLALVLALPCSALAKDALDYYNDMEKAMERVDSLAGRMTGTVTVSMEDVSESLDFLVNYQAVKRSADNYDMVMTMTMSMMGESFDIQAYARDGWIYMKELESGDKVKTRMDSFSPVSGDMKINSSAVRSSEVAQVDGMTRITLSLDTSAMQDYLKFFLSAAFSESELKGLKVERLSYSALMASNGLPDKERIRFVVSYKEGGDTFTLDYDINNKMGKYNSIDAISFPDLSSYPEA